MFSLQFAVTNCTALFEGEDANAGTQNTGTGNQNTGTGNKPPGKTITQDELNTILAKERKATQTKLEQMQENLNLTDEQKKTVEAQLEEFKVASMTEKEKAARQLQKLQEESETKFKAVSEDRDLWKNRYNDSIIDTDLTNASVTEEAFNPVQIKAILKPISRTVEVVGEDGKPTGTFTTKIKIKTIGTDKKPVELDLTPVEAVKHLKEQKEFANLFKGTQVSGLGLQNGSDAKPGSIDLKSLTHEQYQKLRKENPKALGL